MDSTWSSMLELSVWFFFTACGSNLPFLSLGDIKADLPEGGGDGLSAVTVSAVIGFLVFVVILGIAELFIHFGFPHPLQGISQQVLEHVLYIGGILG